MNIAVYDIREDEKLVFRRIEQESEISFQYIKDHLTVDTVSKAAKSDGIAVLGHNMIGEDILKRMAEMGVCNLATRTVGYNHIDLQAAARHGIRVCNSQYGPHGVADFTVMLMLMSLRKYKQALFRANVNDYSLKGLQGREMKDMVIGIIGSGNIGAQVIHNLAGFGCRILVYDTRVNPAIENAVEYTSLDELYSKSDIISLHVPLLDGTRQMINCQSIAKMKKGVILINCARGELMNIADIIEAIESERIGALALDVFENEEGIYHFDRRTDIITNRDMAYLRQFPNVTMTQHIAFYTDSAVDDMVSISVRALYDLHIGSAPLNRLV